jgi:hypothetical protein
MKHRCDTKHSQKKPVLKVTGKTLSLIVNNGTPDYLNSSDDTVTRVSGESMQQNR